MSGIKYIKNNMFAKRLKLPLVTIPNRLLLVQMQ